MAGCKFSAFIELGISGGGGEAEKISEKYWSVSNEMSLNESTSLGSVLFDCDTDGE